MSKPYKYPLKYQAWRMITKNCITEYVEIVEAENVITQDDETKINFPIKIASNCGKKLYLKQKQLKKNPSFL